MGGLTRWNDFMHPPHQDNGQLRSGRTSITIVIMSEFFDPPIETQNIVLVDGSRLRLAERLIIACEDCSPVDAELPFAAVLDRVTGYNPTVTEYILEWPAKCPHCRGQVHERTLVEPDIDY